MRNASDNDDPKQFGNPSGESGKKVLNNMNDHHRDLAEWALSVLPEIDPKSILDIGCGGGMLISLLAKEYEGCIRGIDISEDAVQVATSYNQDIVDEGRCSITKNSVSNIPYRDGTFDLVTAFETYFFWPDLANDIKEAARVLSDNGTMLIVSEVYPNENFKERNDRLVKEYEMNILENNSLAELMEEANLDVEIVEIEENNWVAFLGRKN